MNNRHEKKLRKEKNFENISFYQLNGDSLNKKFYVLALGISVELTYTHSFTHRRAHIHQVWKRAHKHSESHSHTHTYARINFILFSLSFSFQFVRLMRTIFLCSFDTVTVFLLHETDKIMFFFFQIYLDFLFMEFFSMQKNGKKFKINEWKKIGIIMSILQRMHDV